MTYELAKQLKDAGFKYDWERKCPMCNEEGSHFECPKSQPSLSELIEACGENFYQLNYMGKDSTKEIMWSANNGVDEDESSWGSTPEEAVAKLWLEINKNELSRN